MTLAPEQFEQQSLEHLTMLYRVARRLTHDVGGAEDLVQETYLRALRGRRHFVLRDFGMRPWLIRIMRNVHFSRSVRESHQPDKVDDERLESAKVHQFVEWYGNGMDGMDQKLVQAIRELPEEYQTVLMLWAVEELSYKEIAQACDIPIGTVMSRLYRAKARMAERLRDYSVAGGVIRKQIEVDGNI